MVTLIGKGYALKIGLEYIKENYKEYIVVTFLAILEMAKKHELRIIQEDNFDNIICEGM